jgi:hypothetical protein
LRILWLDDKCRHNRFDDWLHWHFAKYIRHYGDVFFYSPFIHEVEPSYTPIPYDKNILLKDIVDQLKIDCVIMDTKGAAFHNYLPDTLYHDLHKGHVYWLPKDFKECKVLKICIEEDFQYETTDDWHKEHGFSAIIQRHYSQYIRTENISLPKHFFPFSVDPTVFYPRTKIRRAKVGFAGTKCASNVMQGGSIYRPRETAYDILHANGLLAEFTVVSGGDRLSGSPYVEYLQKYMAYLCCGSVYHITPAKMVEIMASGGILFTDDQTSGLDLMFPNDAYLTYGYSDASGLLGKVGRVFEDMPFREEMVKKGLECIKEKHTHDVRIKELFDIIERYR